jgi:glutamate synthase domain-containing protein 2/glutamate synthase domain-containing protein 1/glutamate synthase domain-containing protein 3
MESVFQGHPDHDACGTGFIVQLHRPATYEVVDRALEALRRLTHRGGADADGRSGDGVGLLTELPQEFLRQQADDAGIRLPESFAVGMLFLPAEPGKSERTRLAIAGIAARRGLRFLGWREVPVRPSVLGNRAAVTVPSIWQCFIAAAHEAQDLEVQLFLFRKQAETKLGSDTYFCSLSSRTIVYKGLLTPQQLPLFYPDLARPEFKSRFAIFHQRFSTNTQPAWRLAQPFRFLAHNGEINTIVGNRRWAHAREAELRRIFNAGEWFHSLEQGVSDSASLDNALELRVRQGSSPEAALLTLTPPAFEADLRMPPDARKFLESSAVNYEPWDGPAALIFSDGRILGAKLDRNGLRPMRYTRSADGWLVAGSEAGIVDFTGKKIVERQRLGPGQMLLVDLASGQVMRNGELLQMIASQAATPSPVASTCVPELGSDDKVSDPARTAAALGWSEDQVRLLLHPLADGKEPIWSMGDDTPPAFMSRMRRTMWDYCKQRFAQVTNPPIDHLREAHIMSLTTYIGDELKLQAPVVSSGQVELLKNRLSHEILDITFPAEHGVSGGLDCLRRLENSRDGDDRRSVQLIILSDRRVGCERAALPALLAVAAVWKAMVRAGEYRTPLVVESGQVIETHSVALLLAAGATAVCPFLAMHLAGEHCDGGAENYRGALHAGLKKVLSRMGISTLASYRNSQLFETVGLDQQLSARFFESAAHVAEANSLEKVLADYLENHRLAFAQESPALKDAGWFRYRRDGERHATSPELLREFQAHGKAPGTNRERSLQIEVLGQTREPIAIRDLLTVAPGDPVALSEVEPESEILHRFSTQAMSLGAISPEAHRTLALAMSALGARSNTGEGGEDPNLYLSEPEAANRVKQVASGRFGVTAEYLVHASEIEIKMAQGSKPGEGGQLPATKVSAYIARLRHAVPGMALISPPPHHDIYSIEDLEQLIHDLREVNPQARIGVKLVSGTGVGIIAAGVAKAGADVITISGHDGGTGASPLSSIKNTGLPWEFGLQETHRTLVKAGSRSWVRLRVDGGFKFARDVVIAALLGADEFGFGTAALLAMGCVMARQCHLNTCPVGIATQDQALRTRFSGKPEMVVAYFQAIAADVRASLAALGVRSLTEITGRGNEYLRARDESGAAWIDSLLKPVARSAASNPRPAGTRSRLARRLTRILRPAGALPKGRLSITNEDRSIGAALSGVVVRRFGSSALTAAPADLEFEGVAGQSFGAFLAPGIVLRLHGEANDYVGKGLSGGAIAVTAGYAPSLRGDVLVGNAALYGATAGELFVAGFAGERFAVRNSGALAVAEGLGDHGCEYMTGGVALILGATGINFGSGMTGGLAYILNQHLRDDGYNKNFVRPEACSHEEERWLRLVLQKHLQLTWSPLASRLLAFASLPFVRLEPVLLPCPVHQTWANVLPRLQMPPAQTALAAGMTLGASSRQQSVEISSYSAEGS